MSAVEEELDEIRAYDKAKISHDDGIPLAEAINEIEDEPNDNNQIA